MTKDEEDALRAAIRAAKTLADQKDLPDENRRDVLDKLLRVQCEAANQGRSAIKSAAYRARRALRGRG